MAWGDLMTALQTPVRPASTNAAFSGGGGTPRIMGSAGADTLQPVTPAGGGTPQPTPRITMPEASGGAPDAAVIPPPRPRPTIIETGRRPRITPAGSKKTPIRDAAGDFAIGAAGVDRRASPFSAFAQGMAGTLKSERDRTEAERTAALDAEQLQYDRERDARADDRADASLDLQRQRLELDEKRLNSSGKYVDDYGQLTPEGVKEVYGFVNDEADSLRDFYQQSGLMSGSRSAEIEAKISTYLEEYRRNLEDAMRAGKSPFEVPRPVDEAAKAEFAAGGPPPKKPDGSDYGADEEIPKTTETRKPGSAGPKGDYEGPGVIGNGTKDQPYRGYNTPEEVLKNVKPGEWYVAPNGDLMKM